MLKGRAHPAPCSPHTWAEETPGRFSIWQGYHDRLAAFILEFSPSLIAAMDRSRSDLQNEIHGRTARASVSEPLVCNRETHSLVGGFTLSLRVWIGGSVKFARGRFSALGPRHQEAWGSDSKPVDPKNGRMLFAFFFERRKTGLVPKARLP
jgi:hypothetical protein